LDKKEGKELAEAIPIMDSVAGTLACQGTPAGKALTDKKIYCINEVCYKN
jgi:hypothetical protein